MAKTKWKGFGSMTEAQRHEIAKAGGRAVVKKMGKGHMREIAKIAVKARKKAARLASFGAKV